MLDDKDDIRIGISIAFIIVTAFNSRSEILEIDGKCKTEIAIYQFPSDSIT